MINVMYMYLDTMLHKPNRLIMCLILHPEINLYKNDHKDMSSIPESVSSELPEKTALLFQSQLKTLNSNPHTRRRSPEIIRLFLTLFRRSPRAYQVLTKNVFLTLPSTRQIQRVKNLVDHEAGVKKEVLQWMKIEAEKLNLPEEGYQSGLLIDEMTNKAEIGWV